MSVPRTGSTGVPALSRNTRIGLVLAVVLSAAELTSGLSSTPSGQAGPPRSVDIADFVLAVLTIVAVVFAWRRRSRSLIRVIAVLRVADAATALPAFFVTGVPTGLVIAASAFVLITALTVVLLMSRGPTTSRTFTTTGDSSSSSRQDLPTG